MSVLFHTSPATLPGPTGVSAAAASVRTSRVQRHALRYRYAALISLALVTATCTGAALAGHGHGTSVLVLSTDKGWSERLHASDLTAVDVDSGTINAIPAHDRERVIGRTMTTAAAAGTVLTPRLLGSAHYPPGGAHLVGLRAEAGQRPAQPLHAGALVCVSPLPAALPCNADGATRGGSFRAHVATTSTKDAQGICVVDVIVGHDRLAPALAAADQPVIITLIGP